MVDRGQILVGIIHQCAKPASVRWQRLRLTARVVRAGAAVWAATLVLWAFFLLVIASKLGQKDATVAEKKAAQRDRRRRTCVTRL